MSYTCNSCDLNKKVISWRRKNIYSYNFGRFWWVYHNFFAPRTRIHVSWRGSGPAKWYGSSRIRIRNTEGA